MFNVVLIGKWAAKASGKENLEAKTWWITAAVLEVALRERCKEDEIEVFIFSLSIVVSEVVSVIDENTWLGEISGYQVVGIGNRCFGQCSMGRSLVQTRQTLLRDCLCRLREPQMTTWKLSNPSGAKMLSVTHGFQKYQFSLIVLV